MRPSLTIRALQSIASPWAYSAALLWAGCSAPDGRELFVPFELAGRGVGGAAGVTNGGSADAGALGVSGRTNGEGQGGLASSLGGAGGALEPSRGGAASVDADATDAGVDAVADAAPTPPVCLAEDERCDGIDNDCDGEVDPGATCPAQCAGFTLDARAYMFCSLALARAAAQARCQAQEMRLVWLETPEENAAVLAGIGAADVPAAAGNTEVLTHIGGSDAADEGEWLWVGNGVAAGGPQFWEGESSQLGGEVVNDAYVAWANLEPNDEGGEDCAVISVLGSAIREPGEWDDRDCTLALPFVCEVP